MPSIDDEIITPENHVETVYSTLLESIKERLVGENTTRDDKLVQKPYLLRCKVSGRANTKEIFETSNRYYRDHETSPSRHGNSETDDNMSISSVNTVENNLYLNFVDALNSLLYLYNRVDFGSNGILDPPPVPVTPSFRRYNPQASNAFDSGSCEENYEVDSKCTPQFYSVFRDSITSCLVHADTFSKMYKLFEMNEKVIVDKINTSKNADESFKLLNILFGWYFSGYFTGRMEAIAQSGNYNI